MVLVWRDLERGNGVHLINHDYLLLLSRRLVGNVVRSVISIMAGLSLVEKGRVLVTLIGFGVTRFRVVKLLHRLGLEGLGDLFLQDPTFLTELVLEVIDHVLVDS